MQPTSKILERIRKSSTQHKDGVFTRLFRYLLREDVYYMAYENLYANAGAGTKGTDNDTADGFSEKYIKQTIEMLRNGSYEPKPVRRVYIPKSKGKRPLGIPSFRDKLVQEVIRMYLEAIYEPIFSDKSHGFRANRSCHTAIMQIQNGFNGIKWFIEGDIKGCFDNINHEVLLKLLTKKIKDSKFVNIIRKFLKAGYMEQWKYNATYSGTPQGGIISPILANIYLHELDCKVDELKKQFDRQAIRQLSKEYTAMCYRIAKAKKLVAKAQTAEEREELIAMIKQMRKRLRKIPAKDASDKKIVYVRYADDFLIGVNGTKKECQQIRQFLKEFLAQHLQLELSDEKTKITHSSENARFLGYDISIRRNSQTKRRSDGIIQRTLNQTVQLLVPLQGTIQKFLTSRGIARIVKGKLESKYVNPLTVLTDLEIVDKYNAQTRGICNYYSLASNFSKLDFFVYIMEYSCLKTLAKKHKMSISKIIKKYRCGKTWAIPYETKKGKKRMQIARIADIRQKRGKKHADTVDIIAEPRYGLNALENRLKANKCELCGAENAEYEIHHINKLKNLKGKAEWEKVMIARKRKTLVVCKQCHYKIHGRAFNET